MAVPNGVAYSFDSCGRFVIGDYNNAKTFSSFLPGVAGIDGKPAWVFYVNRGQGIASFGVRDKDGAMMEFYPANKSYAFVPTQGFRTFIKLVPVSSAAPSSGPASASTPATSSAAPSSPPASASTPVAPSAAPSSGPASASTPAAPSAAPSSAPTPTRHVYEPFSPASSHTGSQQMLISAGKFELDETNEAAGLSVHITYFTVPHESFAGLMRRVTITNVSGADLRLEVLDGAPAILPFGTGNFVYKELGNTIKAWMDVFNLPGQSGIPAAAPASIPYYKLRASTADSAEVSGISAGHFLASFATLPRSGDAVALKPLVDAELIFGRNTSYSTPDAFGASPLAEIVRREQVTANKVPCGFAPVAAALAPGQTLEICSIFGHTSSIEAVEARGDELLSLAYFDRKERENDELTRELTDVVAATTAEPVFDAYVRQCYLDNTLRGGRPIQLAGPDGAPLFTYHVYSRKHGDLERDYNFFSLEPAYYSQGNGNFRDANQNRRSDVLLHPFVGDYDVRTFMGLIQADGYNPLQVRGCLFTLKAAAGLDASGLPPAVADRVRGADSISALAALLASPFTPGALLALVADRGLSLTCEPAELLAAVLAESEQSLEADFGEGYWIDHWTYNLDLIEAYLTVYPDRAQELLFGQPGYPYYDSPGVVLPRSLKHVLAAPGKVRQYGAMLESKEKEALLHSRAPGVRTWAHTQAGQGEVYRASLYAKLLHLATVKFATLDPEGLGIEAEANKPGWNDSLNGLPGIFASGFGETTELLRVVNFLAAHVSRVADAGCVRLPIEAAALLRKLMAAGVEHPVTAGGETSPADRFRYWDITATAREDYRAATLLGFDGTEAALEESDVAEALAAMQQRLRDAMDRALVIGGGIYPTFFYYEATAWEVLTDDHGEPLTGFRGLSLVRVTEFERGDLPHWLEGPCRAMKVLDDPAAKARLHEAIRAGELYDKKLHMYKTNESLADVPMEIGRGKAFTPGWLENESVFMHMEFKYLLELLRAGMHDEFFGALRGCLPPFMDPHVYGRSTLENSSFIASSANPDPSLHGTGFVARLSGSTAELLSMWSLMTAGPAPFVPAADGTVSLALAPSLPSWLFRDEDGTLTFRFLGQCDVTYVNPSRANTFGPGAPTVQGYELPGAGEGGTDVTVTGAILPWPLAGRVRSGSVKQLRVKLG